MSEQGQERPPQRQSQRKAAEEAGRKIRTVEPQNEELKLYIKRGGDFFSIDAYQNDHLSGKILRMDTVSIYNERNLGRRDPKILCPWFDLQRVMKYDADAQTLKAYHRIIASRDFNVDELVTIYEGKERNDLTNAQQLYTHEFEGTNYYAAPTMSYNFAHFINEPSPGQRVNAEFNNDKQCLTTKPILKGEEILVDYGDAYPRDYNTALYVTLELNDSETVYPTEVKDWKKNAKGELQKGLFATATIPLNTPVARMKEPKIITQKELEITHAEEYEFRNDYNDPDPMKGNDTTHVKSSPGKIFLEMAFHKSKDVSLENVPKWWYMNYPNKGDKPNVKMKIVDNVLYWLTTKVIQEGDQLVYDYKGERDGDGSTTKPVNDSPPVAGPAFSNPNPKPAKKHMAIITANHKPSKGPAPERDSSSDDDNDKNNEIDRSKASLRRNAHNIISKYVSPTPVKPFVAAPDPKRRKQGNPPVHGGHNIPFIDKEDSEDEFMYISSDNEEVGTELNPIILSNSDSD